MEELMCETSQDNFENQNLGAGLWYSGILSPLKRNEVLITCYNMNEIWKYNIKWNKSKVHYCNCTYRKYPEQVNPQWQNADSGLPRAGEREEGGVS